MEMSGAALLDNLAMRSGVSWPTVHASTSSGALDGGPLSPEVSEALPPVLLGARDAKDRFCSMETGAETCSS